MYYWPDAGYDYHEPVTVPDTATMNSCLGPSPSPSLSYTGRYYHESLVYCTRLALTLAIALTIALALAIPAILPNSRRMRGRVWHASLTVCARIAIRVAKRARARARANSI